MVSRAAVTIRLLIGDGWRAFRGDEAGCQSTPLHLARCGRHPNGRKPLAGSVSAANSTRSPKAARPDQVSHK